MIWKFRKGRAYAYRSIRIGGRSTTSYVAGSGMSAEAATAMRRREAKRRAKRAAALATWLTERRELEEAERSVEEVDSAYGELAAAAMRAAGYHKPGRGRWRKRRGGGAGDEGALATLLHLLEGGPDRFGPPISPEVEALRDELAGPDAGVLERRLAERVALAWSDAHDRDVAAEEAAVARKSPLEVDFLEAARTRANGRVLAAARDLALVKGRAIPALSGEIGPTVSGGLGINGDRIVTKMLGINEDASGEEALQLIKRASGGDQAAFEELKSIGDYTSGFSSAILQGKLQHRAGGETNLLAHDSVAKDLAAVTAGLAAVSDGPIERLLLRRAAVCVVDAGLADREHLESIRDPGNIGLAEVLDRRRDRAHRRLLQTLRVLAQVRRLNRVAVQVNVGDNNLNILKA